MKPLPWHRVANLVKLHMPRLGSTDEVNDANIMAIAMQVELKITQCIH